MASTANKQAFTSTAQLACTIGSLVSGSTRESASRNVTTNLEFDDQISLTFTLASGAPSTTGPSVNIYANGSVDGTLWPIIQLSSGAVKATSGTDNSIGALGSVPNLFLIGSFGIQTTTTNAERTFRTQPFAVGPAFAELPSAYSILIENSTGVAFSSSTLTTANFIQLSGIFSTSGN